MVYDKDAQEWRPRWGYKVFYYIYRLTNRKQVQIQRKTGLLKTSSFILLLSLLFKQTVLM